MNKYIYSTIIHIILLLWLISFKTWPKEPKVQLQHAIVVDFSDSEDYKAPKSVPKPIKNSAPKPNSKSVEKIKKDKAIPIKKPNISSSSPKEAEVKKTTENLAKEKARLREKQAAIEAAEKEAERIKMEEEQQRKEKEARDKAEKVDYFKNLINNSLSKSKEKKRKENDHTSAKTSELNDNNGPISGEISSRKVLKTPNIKDNSQREGRVVVKICVDKSGSVISSKYTQIGSTTADSHLIKLAEEGAKDYKFSTADIDRQCGRVVIDFTLRA